MPYANMMFQQSEGHEYTIYFLIIHYVVNCNNIRWQYCDRHARYEKINHVPLTWTMQNMLSVALKMFFAHVVVILSFSHHSNISSGVLISQQKPRWLWWIRKVDMIQVSIIYKKYLENGKKLSWLNCLQHDWRDFPKPSKKQRAEFVVF